MGLTSGCQVPDDGGTGHTVCNVFSRDGVGERLVGKQVSLPGTEHAASVRAGRLTVRLIASVEEGTPGALVVTIVDARDRELASGHYQFGDDVRDQFRGGHGFTGLVVWNDPTTGAQVQYYCGRS